MAISLASKSQRAMLIIYRYLRAGLKSYETL
jgi:hypothetical protein